MIRRFNATVTNSVLEIRLYWGGKGTTRIPLRGHYGALISAISVDSSMYLLTFSIFGWTYRDFLRLLLFPSLSFSFSFGTAFKFCSNEDRKTVIIYVIVGVLAACITFFVLSILWWKGYLCRKRKRRGEHEKFLK